MLALEQRMVFVGVEGTVWTQLPVCLKLQIKPWYSVVEVDGELRWIFVLYKAFVFPLNAPSSPSACGFNYTSGQVLGR